MDSRQVLRKKKLPRRGPSDRHADKQMRGTRCACEVTSGGARARRWTAGSTQIKNAPDLKFDIFKNLYH